MAVNILEWEKLVPFSQKNVFAKTKSDTLCYVPHALVALPVLLQ